jgi:hypothetical protein
MPNYEIPGGGEPIKKPESISEAIEKENTTTPEKEPRYPSLEEIKNQMKQFSGEQEFEVVRTKEDEKGIFLHEEIYVNENGDTTLYTYGRIKPHLQSDGVTIIIATLEVAYFNGKLEDGDCSGGNGLSDYTESGEWQLNK